MLRSSMITSRRIAPVANRLVGGARVMSAQTSAAQDDMVLLQQLLAKAKDRVAQEKAAAAAEAAGDSSAPKFQIQTFNAISPKGLEKFPTSTFALTGSSGPVPEGAEDEPHAILLRSHKLKSEEVASSVRAIARCGAGTNNIPIAEMTERGIPVFNTPGANANSVKELVLCGLLLASRGIIEGITHTRNTIVPEEKGNHQARL